MILKRLLIASILAVLCTTLAVADLTVVEAGKSNYEIIVSKDAFPITLRAAADLQRYMEKSTGARLPIIRADAVGADPAIVVGDGRVSRSLGVSLDEVKAEGFRIKTVGRNLVIAGRDTAGGADSDHWRLAPQGGTWNGVDQFLEKELSIRWFMPGDDGEYVPHCDRLVVKDQDYTDAPVMTYRRMNYIWDAGNPPARIQTVRDWERHNRNGWSIVWNSSHSWREYFKAETYFKDHPDWFALVNGSRVSDSPYGAKMCTTNPGALDEFARVIIEFGRRNPGVMFSLSPNDSGDFCECENCRTLDRKKFPDGTPVLTDRIITYANEVAKRVNKVLPDQTFGLYAYSYYTDPPVYARLDPHVYIMEVENDINTRYHSKQFVDCHLNERLIPWKRSVGTLYFYSHPEGFGSMGAPVMHQRVLKRLFKNLAAAGVEGYDMNNSSGFGSSALNDYLSLKMCWNPNQNIDALYDDALAKCYGEKGATLVRQYFDVVEERWGRYADKALSAQNIALGGARIFPGAFDIVLQGLYDEGMPLIKKAISLTDDKGQQARLKLLVDDLEYTRMTVDLYNLSRKVIGSAGPAREDVLAARNLANSRVDFIMEHVNSNLFTTADEVFSVEKTWNLPFNPQVYDGMLLKVSGGKSSAGIRAVKTPPSLDCNLIDPAWQGAQEIRINQRKDDASKSDVSTVARLVRDGRNIYIIVRCDEPLMSQVKDSITAHGGPIWNENEVEIFFDPAGTKKGYRQIMANSLGAVTDMKSDGGDAVPWKSDVNAVAKRDMDGWTLEMAVPIASITDNPVCGGDIWGLNICRVRNVGGISEYTCWSPTFGGFGQPEMFGNLIFK